MTTLRSNNSKNINPIFKYFTDLKNSDKSALIKHSHTSLRPLILLLIIVCTIVFWVGMSKSSSNAPYIQRKKLSNIIYTWADALLWLTVCPCVCLCVCMSLKRNLIKICYAYIDNAFVWQKNAMSTLRSNNSKSINPIFKYFTD